MYLYIYICIFCWLLLLQLSNCNLPGIPSLTHNYYSIPFYHYIKIYFIYYCLLDHFCGRVTIDIPSLRPDMEYDITFPLRASSFIYDRRPRGVVRVRFSIHWFSPRAAALSYLKRPKNPLAFSKQVS